ncbi:MAG: RNA polymerase sigma-54 factor, partial [Alphaproteobacteria bacterium]|nr:RNA polymerase sigma-54 factor [Alphaproteobacteria bacterium]
MSLSQRLDQRQSQTLIMTPQLQQAIKLLQMTNLELGDFVEQELEKNPLLERADFAAAELPMAKVAAQGSANPAPSAVMLAPGSDTPSDPSSLNGAS